MNNFIQNIRFKNSEIHKEQIYRFVDNLQIKEDAEYQCIIKPYKSSKTLEQLGYYWTAVITTTRLWQGLTKIEADHFLKAQCCAPIYKEILGERYEIRKSIASMKVNEMSEYLDDCINFLGSHGEAVPPPTWKEGR